VPSPDATNGLHSGYVNVSGSSCDPTSTDSFNPGVLASQVATHSAAASLPTGGGNADPALQKLVQELQSVLQQKDSDIQQLLRVCRCSIILSGETCCRCW
jgi:hypothetical protein